MNKRPFVWWLRCIKWITFIGIPILIACYIFRSQLSLIIHAPPTGTAIDSFNHVKVYYNGTVGHIEGRNTAADGYNIGLKFQCVEFVKRYYYEYYHHKMPDSYGHAVSFFDTELQDGSFNKKRDLIQYSNPSLSKPRTGDLLIFKGSSGNPYGHVAIISAVKDSEIEIIQQNPGIGASSRINITLTKQANKFRIDQERIIGWLRIKV